MSVKKNKNAQNKVSGKAVVEALEALSLKQAEFAHIVGRSYTTISAWKKQGAPYWVSAVLDGLMRGEKLTPDMIVALQIEGASPIDLFRKKHPDISVDDLGRALGYHPRTIANYSASGTFPEKFISALDTYERQVAQKEKIAGAFVVGVLASSDNSTFIVEIPQLNITTMPCKTPGLCIREARAAVASTRVRPGALEEWVAALGDTATEKDAVLILVPTADHPTSQSSEQEITISIPIEGNK